MFHQAPTPGVRNAGASESDLGPWRSKPLALGPARASLPIARLRHWHRVPLHRHAFDRHGTALHRHRMALHRHRMALHRHCLASHHWRCSRHQHRLALHHRHLRCGHPLRRHRRVVKGGSTRRQGLRRRRPRGRGHRGRHGHRHSWGRHCHRLDHGHLRLVGGGLQPELQSRHLGEALDLRCDGGQVVAQARASGPWSSPPQS